MMLKDDLGDRCVDLDLSLLELVDGKLRVSEEDQLFRRREARLLSGDMAVAEILGDLVQTQVMDQASGPEVGKIVLRSRSRIHEDDHGQGADLALVRDQG